MQTFLGPLGIDFLAKRELVKGRLIMMAIV